MRMTKDNWIVLGILGVVVTAFVGLILLPQWRHLQQAQEGIAQVVRTMDSDRAEADQFSRTKRQLAALREESEAVGRRLPPRKELAEFLKDLSTIVLAQRLENQVIQPGSTVPGPPCSRLPISCSSTAASTACAASSASSTRCSG